MSTQYGKVVSLIITERFGPIIEQIVTFLYNFGSSSLLHIKRSLNMPLSKVCGLLVCYIIF